jgi:hypothetical protein
VLHKNTVRLSVNLYCGLFNGGNSFIVILLVVFSTYILSSTRGYLTSVFSDFLNTVYLPE